MELFGIDQLGVIAIIKYLLVAIPLVFLLFYFTTLKEFKLLLEKTKSKTLQDLLKKEFETDNNYALGIYLGAKFLSICTLVSFTMVLNLFGMVVFTVIAYLVQQFSVVLMEKLLNLEVSFEEYVLDKQNVPVVLLYSGVIVGLSGMIGSVFIG